MRNSSSISKIPKCPLPVLTEFLLPWISFSIPQYQIQILFNFFNMLVFYLIIIFFYF